MKQLFINGEAETGSGPTANTWICWEKGPSSTA